MTLSLKQREERKKGLGGSDIAGILGLSKWSTPYDIWCSKMNDVKDVEEEQTEVQKWGNRLEGVIIEEYQERTGKECIIVDADAEPFKHPQYPFLLGNVDALIKGERSALEVKMARFSGDWGKHGTDEIPTAYLLQVAHYSSVLELEKVYVSVLVGGSELRFYEYIKNERLEKSINQKSVAWWQRHIIDGEVPCPMNTSDALAMWSQQTEGLVKIATPEVAKSLETIRSYKGLHSGHNKLIEAQKTNIFTFMQDAESLVDENGITLATWKAQTANRFDSDKFKKDHPELYKQYLKQSSSRVLRIKGE